MILSYERAQEIIKAFGPCSVLYECVTVEELVQDAVDSATELDLINLRLDLESIHADREDLWQEWSRDMKPGILARLRAIGLVVTKQ